MASHIKPIGKQRKSFSRCKIYLENEAIAIGSCLPVRFLGVKDETVFKEADFE